MKGASIPAEKLRLYDDNIYRHTRQISEKRGDLRWKYFQYVALVFTVMYLDRYFTNVDAFCADLNAWLQDKRGESIGLIDFEPYKAQYMEDFKSYLEHEGTPANDNVRVFRLPVISRF